MFTKPIIFGVTSSMLCFLSNPALGSDFTGLAQDGSETITQPATLETRGVLQTKQMANIAAGMSGRILRAPYKSGQKFKRGALLVKFDCEQLTAEKLALIEIKNAAKLKHENAKELLLAGAAGELEVNIANADVRRAQAELGVANVALKKCTIYAPFNGTVQEKLASSYDTVAVNTPLLIIIKNGTPEIKLIAPSAWLAWVKQGSLFEFTIDETGTTHSAKILRKGASVDPVSQTIELTARFTASTPAALAGMSGIATFKQNTSK